jgi:hypothetical protein
VVQEPDLEAANTPTAFPRFSASSVVPGPLEPTQKGVSWLSTRHHDHLVDQIEGDAVRPEISGPLLGRSGIQRHPPNTAATSSG